MMDISIHTSFNVIHNTPPIPKRKRAKQRQFPCISLLLSIELRAQQKRIIRLDIVQRFFARTVSKRRPRHDLDRPRWRVEALVRCHLLHLRCVSSLLSHWLGLGVMAMSRTRGQSDDAYQVATTIFGLLLRRDWCFGL